MSTRYILLIIAIAICSCSLPTKPGILSIAGVALEVAQEYEGVPYVWGGQNKEGIDCSGLVLESYRESALRLGVFFVWEDETVASMYPMTDKTEQPYAGCLIFMGEDTISHVAIFSHISNGEVYFIDSFSGSGKVEMRKYPIGHYKIKEYRAMPEGAFYGI